MKILLVTSNTVIGAYDAPPLGLYRLKSELAKYGHDCDIFDTCLYGSDIDYLSKARNGEYQIIGFSVTHNQMEDDIITIDKFRSVIQSDCLFIAGGQEATYNFDEWLNVGIDVVVLGYGERGIVALADAFENSYLDGKNKLIDIAGIVYKESGKLIFNKSEPLSQEEFDRLTYSQVKNLDIPYEKYWEKAKKETFGLNLSKSIFIPETVRLLTSSHCPHRCGFCSSHQFLSFSQQSKAGVFRISAEQVFDLVLWHIKNVDAKGFLFSDDEFLIDKKRAIAFCDYVIEAKENNIIDKNVLFNCQARVLDFLIGPENAVDFEFIKKLSKAGFHSIGMGVETFSDRLLLQPSLNKTGFGKRECLDVISALLIEKIVPHVFIIIFVPETTNEEIIDTLQTSIGIIKMGGEIVVNPILRALPGAPIYGDPRYRTSSDTIIIPSTGANVSIQTHFIPHDEKIAQAAEQVMASTNREINEFETKWKHGKIPKTIAGVLMFIASAKLLGRDDLAQEWMGQIDEIVLDLNLRSTNAKNEI